MELAGEYYLQGVREMASGFLMKEDNTFQFFFSYGALDRHGSGHWRAANDVIFFNSDAAPAASFTLVSSTKEEHPFINVMLEGNDPMTNAYTHVSLQEGAEGSWKNMSQRGDVQFEPQEVNSIALLFEFCPDRKIIIPVNKEHNAFTFRIHPAVAEVYFNNFSLIRTLDGLIGKHPVMEGNAFVYGK